ncbi:phosphatidate cytidylyltransferase [uncultured Thiodictyon sp.]|uniref:phosphatidate cytidylyltransferase n=1 Tax=uncultured Thiodictyon sp. TaxID=1846217 RepID=UPI0025D8F975|nr:phosphatidate cytidylyltransferase [uncultured Thiodictyon sp.]
MSDAKIMTAGSALRQRVVTAFILGPLVMGAVLWLPASAFAVFMALVVLIGAWEWAGLSGLSARVAQVAYVILVAVGLASLWFLPPWWRTWLVAAGVAWWVIQTVALVRIQHIEPRTGLDGAGAATGLLVLCVSWTALITLRDTGPAGPALVLFLLLLIWFADSAAYFAGRRWGRSKLAPGLSPGKTLEGVYGALAVAGIGGVLLGAVLAPRVGGILLAVAVCAVTVVMSVVGDLYESLLKRRRGVKDSGQLLPGHGGFLDRIDSLTAAAPLFMLGIKLFLPVVHT